MGDSKKAISTGWAIKPLSGWRTPGQMQRPSCLMCQRNHDKASVIEEIGKRKRAIKLSEQDRQTLVYVGFCKSRYWQLDFILIEGKIWKGGY